MELVVCFVLCAVALAGAITVETKLDFQGGDSKKVEAKGCISSGCNTTRKLETSDTIVADVVVEVKTNLDVKNNTEEEVPDVPIVLGYAGVEAENKKEQDNAINPNPIIVSSFDPSYPDVKNGAGFVPLPMHKQFYDPYSRRNNFNHIPRPDWRMSPPWFQRPPPPAPTSSWTACTCHPTASWQPTPSYRYNPGPQINGKLAPLN